MLIDLSDDTLCEICKYLAIVDISKISRLNRKLHQFYQKERLWKLLIFREFNVDKIMTAHKIYIGKYHSYKEDPPYKLIYEIFYSMLISRLTYGIPDGNLEFMNYEKMISAVTKAIKSHSFRSNLPSNITEFIDQIKDINANKLKPNAMVTVMVNVNDSNDEFNVITLDGVDLIPNIVIRDKTILWKIIGNRFSHWTAFKRLDGYEQEFFKTTDLEYNYDRYNEYDRDFHRDKNTVYILNFVK